MVIPELPDPPGTGRTLRCVVEKDGQHFVVTAYRTARDAKTDEVHFPAHLYLGDGFTLLAMEGEPDFNSLAEASTTKAEGQKMSHETKHDANDAFGLSCRCGAVCWATQDRAITTPCSGEMNVSEDYPGTYTHFCDGHGHYEDLAEKPDTIEPKDVKK